MSSKIMIFIFFFFYLIMPEYFALEISSSLPLLTVSRILILLIVCFALYQNHGRFKIQMKDRVLNLYVLIMLVINGFHLIDCFSDSAKTIFSLLLEQWLVVALVVNVLNTRDKIEKAINAMVWASFVVGILGILEVFTGRNMFYYLTTTSRTMMQASFFRLGLLRAEGPFGHPVYFGTYCVCILPFSLYLYESRRKKIYLLIAFINMAATFCSGSRGQIMVLALVLLYVFFNKKSSIKRKYLTVIALLIPIGIILILIVPSLRELFVNTMKSLMSSLGFKFDLENYGSNVSGWKSRIWQLSGVVHLIKNNALLLGLGAACHIRGLVQYLWDGVWRTINTFDVGYIGIIMQYGIFGLIAYMRLLVSELRRSIRLRSKNDEYNLNGTFVFFYVAYLLNLLATVGIENMLFLIIGIQLAYLKVTVDKAQTLMLAVQEGN